ncbi:hypothetical protein GGI25_005699 [Coemansia spiralis]|uniref:Uncharacterized protein n=2 Tax=Coemansia TaxID=4863 RepID=A0A9W8G3M7_9FUNG|nr:hypothetical protein EDC05_005457 [Coemansia umbellata]KAJ2625563.1 hypothetical protein GGI26_000362 [Coemansia sp. RSA 1358]KAJ2670821.1 hypothetical protein GGI25_005699 [Coemansia spiralis]
MRRRGRFGTIWLLATAGSRCKWHHISNKEVARVDIPRTCADIILPTAPMSLRLASILLDGLAHALSRKSCMLYTECYCVRSTILSTPWITSTEGFDPSISCITTVSNPNQITLSSDTTNVDCIDISDDDELMWLLISNNAHRYSEHKSNRCKTWRSFGWLGTGDVIHSATVDKNRYATNSRDSLALVDSAGSNCTAGWSSISLPEIQPRHEILPNQHEEIFEAHSSTHNILPIYGSSQVNISNTSSDYALDGVMDLPLLRQEEDEGEVIRFDDNGNLHFISSHQSQGRGYSTDEVHTEIIAQYSPRILTHGMEGDDLSCMVNLPISDHRGDDALYATTVIPLKGDANGETRKRENLCDTDMCSASNFATIDTSAGIDNTEYASNKRLKLSDAILEKIENDLLQHQPVMATTDQADPSRLYSVAGRYKPSSNHRKNRNITSNGCGITFERQITSLWGESCIWSKRLKGSTISAISTRVGQAISRRAASVSRMYTTGHNTGSVSGLFMAVDIDAFSTLSTPQTPRNPRMQSHANEDVDDDYASSAIADFDHFAAMESDHDLELELELGRGVSVAKLEQENDEYVALNLNLNIPWLNPDILDSLQHRQSTSRPISIRTESSPDIGQQHQVSTSLQNIPSESDVPSIDPLLSDTGLDVQPFQLEAQDLQVKKIIVEQSSVFDMDSFLSIGRTHSGADGDKARLLGEIEHELRSFQRYMLARMRECGKPAICFGDILVDPYKTRRVAARAFVDILQMATKSIFRVSQESPFSPISISMF